MKKLFYRLSRSRSFARLFSLLACVALGSLFAQPAAAQFCDQFTGEVCDPTTGDPNCVECVPLGWEPAPPGGWNGGWDARLSCGSVEGTTRLIRTLPSGPDKVFQKGTVNCTFTDTANNFKQTASCLANIHFANLSESCVTAAPNGPSTLTITGTCPFEKGQTTFGATGKGTIDCRGRNPDGTLSGSNPVFCHYAGTNPSGNTGGDCRWNVGYAQLKGSNVAPLTQAQCITAFGDPAQVFSFIQTYAGPACTGKLEGVGGKEEKFCHSDTWDPLQDAFCDFPKGGVKNTALGILEHFLTADTEYSPNTINPICNPQNSGIITLTVFATDHDPVTITNAVAIEEINQASIRVNGHSIKAGTSCTFDVFPNPNVMTCQVNKCENGHNIIQGTIAPDGQTATLKMEACIGNVNTDGKCVGTRVVGDVETRGVSKSVP